MGSSFWSDYNNAVNNITKEVERQAVAYARYKVHEDFNTELIEEIGKKTGHPNLAATCFVDIDLNSDDSLSVHIYNDASWIEGEYHSNSSFHPGSGGWTSVGEHYGMSKDEFWELKFSGESGGDYGGIDTEWIADNFWDGIEYFTNGWPRGTAEYLSVGTRNVVSAISVIEKYFNKYKSSNTYQKYIMEAIARMIK